MKPLMEIPLDRLKYGHEAPNSINSRQTGRDAEIVPLAHSIFAHGLGQPLNVKIDGEEIYVIDGNRRLAALRLNVENGVSDASMTVPCIPFDGGASEIETSLALNYQRVPMHEADSYSVFRQLHANGASADEISTRFGIPVKRVLRMLALGDLAPEVLAAWRDGKFGHQTTEIVRAFTLFATHEKQVETLERLAEKDALSSWNVREATGAGNQDIKRQLEFVGREAFIAGGGVLTVDLFGNDHAVGNPDVLVKMVNDKLEAARQNLLANGWQWAELKSDLPETHWGWKQTYVDYIEDGSEEDKRLDLMEDALEALLVKAREENVDPETLDEIHNTRVKVDEYRDGLEQAAYTPEMRAKLGCKLSLSHYGTIEIVFGVERPSDAPVKAEKTAPQEAAEAKPVKISNALNQRLSEQLTRAVQDVIGYAPEVALSALWATLQTAYAYSDDPMKVRVEGMATGKPRDTRASFTELFNQALQWDEAERAHQVATSLSESLSLQEFTGRSPADNLSTQFFLSAFDPDVFDEAIRVRFDAEDYFKGAAKPLVVAAIAEAVNPDEAAKAAKMKKPDLVAFAVANVAPTGWLPPELRTVHYRPIEPRVLEAAE